MVTYFTIGKIQRSGVGYKNNDITISGLFYADDGQRRRQKIFQGGAKMNIYI